MDPEPERTPTPRRVLMTADAVGGVWSYALELAGALAPSGVEVALAVMGKRPSGAQAREARAVPNLTLLASDYQLEWMDEPWADVERAGRWLLELELSVAPDVIHLNGYAHGALPFRAPVMIVGHSCVLSWWRAVKGQAAPARWETYRRAVRAGIAAAGLVVAPTRAMLEQLASLYEPASATRVIHNGRDRRRFLPGEKQQLVFTAGRLWDEAKNVAAVDECAPALDWPVYAAGPRRHPDGRKVCARNLFQLGELDQDGLARWLARASIYAAPARYEPFGLIPLEAALAGCALVLGDIPTLREIWGDAAVFAAPDDPAALTAAIAGLINAPTRRAALAARARARALELTPQRMAAGYLAAYGALRRGVPSSKESGCES